MCKRGNLSDKCDSGISQAGGCKSIRNILVKMDSPLIAAVPRCQTLQYADDLHNGVVVCGYRLTDMIYSQLREDLSEQFDMLLLASRRFTSEVDDKRIRCVAMPLRVHELLASVDAAIEESELRKKKARQQPKQRNVLDKQQIMLAKDLLMKQKGMTEEEAHRYLQKSSMANGVNMIETAQMVLSILGKNV
mgnify:CR=1 FL=1